MAKVFEPHEIYKNLSLEDMPGEIWGDISNFEGCYQVSNLGRVKSLARTIHRRDGVIFSIRGRILLQIKTPDGYLAVSITKNDKSKTTTAHRLVAFAFCQNPNFHTEVNHIDGNKLNNVDSNLEWCSRSHNNKHAYDMGLSKKGEQHCNCKLSNLDIQKIKELSANGEKNADVAKIFNISPSTVSRIHRGKRRA